MRCIMKYKDSINSLRNRIFCGDYPAGSQLPKQEFLAQSLGITRPTLNRVINQLEDEGLVVRHRDVGVFVSEQVKLKSGMRLGVFRPATKGYSDSNDIFSHMLPYLSDCAQKADCSILTDGFIIEAEEKIMMTRMLEATEHLIKRQIHGVLFVPPELPDEKQKISYKIADMFVAAGIPVVLLDRDLYNFPGKSKYDVVSINHFRGAFTLTEHLIKHGAKKIDFLSSDLHTSAVYGRIGGYFGALSKYGIPIQANRIYNHCRDLQPSMRRIAKHISEKKTDAVVCINDLAALIFFEFLQSKNIRVPQDVRIAGFDDLPIARVMACPLTTIRQPADLLAQAAVATLLQRIAHPDKPACEIEVQEELIIRQSCGSKKP